ncbi:MAG: hypothetical protein AABX86_03130 [Nanoarchaeota archaeon]
MKEENSNTGRILVLSFIGGIAATTCVRTGDIKERLNEIDQKQIRYIQHQLDELDKKTKQETVTSSNVFGDEKPETFYEVNGQRAYLTIDGKPVEEYIRDIRER